MNLNRLGISLAHLLPPELSNKLSLEGLKLHYNLGLLSSMSNQGFQNSTGDQILNLNFPKINIVYHHHRCSPMRLKQCLI